MLKTTPSRKSCSNLSDRWVKEIDQIILVARKKQARILGFVGTRGSSDMKELCARMAGRYAHFGKKTLLVDLCASQKGEEALGEENWSEYLLEEPFRGEDSRLVHLEPGREDEARFGSADKIAQTLAEDHEEFERVIINLPAMFGGTGGITTTLQAATVCDALFVLCVTNEDRRPQVLELFANLKAADIKVDGLVVRESGHPVSECLARLFKRGKA